MFYLAISCLTISSLPWFMDLTLQVPMQYCSLQHWMYFHHQVLPQLLMFPFCPSCCILSGAVSYCPLLFPSSILNTFLLGELIFQCPVFLPFHTVHGVFQARILDWVAISSSSGPWFVVTSLWPIHPGWPCTAWLIASLSYTSLFAMTRLWSMKVLQWMKGYSVSLWRM